MRAAGYTLVVLGIAAAAAAQTTAPIAPLTPGTPPPKVVATTGPDIDPVKQAAKPYDAPPLFATFDGFVSGSYAWAGVWCYADAGDPKATAELCQARVSYPFPKFYKPTWGEVFDDVGRQMKCSWSWDKADRQFKFVPAAGDPFFGVTLADGWRREDRGEYVWHAPKDQQFGLDIYYRGHYTTPGDDSDLAKKVRAHFAVAELADWPNAPAEKDMSVVKVAGREALFIKLDTPRPGGVWRQWSLVADGHAFVIVSAMPKEKEDDLLPAIEKMVDSFKVTAADKATTQPAKGK